MNREAPRNHAGVVMLQEIGIATNEISTFIVITTAHVIGEQISLIDEFHILIYRTMLQHLIKGINIVTHAGDNLPSHIPQIVHHRHIFSKITINRNSFYKRANSGIHPRLGTAIIYTGKGNLLAAQVFGQQ